MMMYIGWKISDNINEDLGIIIGIVGFLSTIVVMIIIAGLISNVFNSSTIEEKIEMYQQENATIESQIEELVENYMEYESRTFEKFKTESSITLVSLYPELKTDTFVQYQITTYTKNNNKIKELKEGLIMRSVYRWWLYFGK